MAIYYVWSGAAGTGTGLSWANAFTTLTLAFATELAGDTLFVAHDHAESAAGNLTFTSSGTGAAPTKVICASRAGTVPPVSADRRATATVSITGNFSITFNGVAHFDGIIFTAGNSTGTGSINLSGTNASLRYDNCSLRCGSSGATSRLLIGGTTTGSGTYVELNNTTVSFTGTGQSIEVNGQLKWRNTLSALLGTIPTELFTPSSGGGGGLVECIGVDLSAAGSGKTIVQNSGANVVAISFMFIDCKLNASVTKASAPTSAGTYEVDFVRSGSAGINYAIHRQRYSGLLVEETTIIRTTGGASDGTTGLSWRVDTTANCSYSMPFECPPIAIWVDTGVPLTATVEGIWGGGAVPLNSECFLDVEYLGDNASPQASFVNDGPADLLAAAVAQDASASAWGGSTTAFKMAVTFTPQQRGWIYARVKCAKVSSTFFIDPLITLT